ncbi:MAG: SDR family NAD(P)-dependent oxidoreductase, partial [Elusimicrobiales bacterium]|nr:SDR family NAD(P)-dependent oxidoreductase [Elusimicrobiales bacterium]
KLITEKTGYPEDMLDLDLDMEADLGIDTVKQAELFAAIREHYSIPRKEGVKLKDYPTIRHCINFVLTETGGTSSSATAPAAIPAPAPVAPKPEPAPAPKQAPVQKPAAPAAGKHSETAVKSVILKLITEKTGYPEDMLDLDLDMEADLGIDTVKQAELFAAIREHYAIPRKEGVKLKDYPTIRHCINFVLTETGGVAPVATAPAAAPIPAPVAHEAEPAPQPAENRIRLLPVITEVPLAAEANRRLSAKRPVLIFSDNSALTRAFQYELAQMKVPTHVFTSSKTRSKNTTIVNWNSLEETAAALRDYSADNPGVQGIIHLLGAVHKRLDKKADAHADLIHYVMPLFHACKVFEKDLADRTDSDTFIAADLLLDGKFGFFAAKDFDPFYGAIAGAVQCFRKDMHELAKTVTKLMDFEPETSVETIARQTLHEVLKGDDRLAIAMRGGKRQTYYASPVSVDKSKKRFNLEGKSFIITGGGRGLGALFGRLAAQQYKPAIIVFDIIKFHPETPQWAAMSEEQLKTLKNSVWETLKADTTRRATPVMLEQEYGRMMDSVQLYRNLEELKRLGAKTDYYTCDVTNLRELDETLKAVKAKYGSVDGVAHFAGLERSKLVNEKTVEEFLRVYDVKAASAMALLASDVVREKGFWMFISSIAGKFGNLGQSDYASASDYIAKLANSLSAKGVRAFAADMSGFAQIGMAARPGVETFLKSQGMEFLQPVEGMQALLDEIVYGETPEIVLSGTLGKLDWDAQLRLEENAPDGGGKTSGGASGAGTKTHFLGAIAKLEKGKTLRAEKEFSLAGDPYLADHSISGTPYVPGVMGIETFMEAAAALLGETPAGLEDVHFSLPIKLLRDKPQTVRIAADKDSKTGAVDMNIESDFINPQGVKMGAARKHFSARTLGEFESAYITMPKTGPSRLKPLASKEEVYKIYFHGPSFQVLDSILSVDDKTVFAVYRRPAAPLWRDPQPQTCAYPLLIEAAFQACGFRDLHADKRMTLPDYIGKLLVSPGGASPEKLYISCVFKGKNKEGKSVYDSCVYDADGRLWVELQDYIMIGS